MSIGYRNFPSIEPSKNQIAAILAELNRVNKLLDLTKHEGWEVLAAELTQQELRAMRALASNATQGDDIPHNRALVQICRYLREMPDRLEQERETLQAELDLTAPTEAGNGRR